MPDRFIDKFRHRRLSIMASLGILILASGFTIEDSDSELIEQRQARIVEAFEMLPQDLGLNRTWLKSADVEIPTSQERMLDLNAHVSRRYQLLGSAPPSRFTLFFAHSSDARSMAGHHPPNCYPASGWLPGEVGVDESVTTLANGRTLPFRVYSFQRGDPGKEIWVANGFVLPDGSGVGTLAEAGGVIGNAEQSRLGLVQYQFVFDGDIDLQEVIEFTDDVLLSIPNALFDALGAPAPLTSNGVSND